MALGARIRGKRGSKMGLKIAYFGVIFGHFGAILEVFLSDTFNIACV
jgi:hypothetical protein